MATPFPVQCTAPSHAILQIFGGDNNLSQYVARDMEEFVRGNRGNFAMLALADFEGYGASVIEINSTKGVRVVEKKGEIDTGDPETLASFLASALVTWKDVPHLALGFWDHGSGVFDEQDPKEVVLTRGPSRAPLPGHAWPARKLFFSNQALEQDKDTRAMLHDETNGGVLTNREAHAMVKVALQRAGLTRKLSMVYSDTCLNGMVEVVDQFKDVAEVVVGSEELEPGDGWSYQEFLTRMTATPPQSGAEWGRLAVEAYESAYRARTGSHPCTLAAFRTGHNLVPAMKALIAALKAAGSTAGDQVFKATRSCQSFAFRETYDLRDFASVLKGLSTSTPVKAACDQVISAFDAACIRNTAMGPTVKGARGLALWVPNTRATYDAVAPTYRTLQFDLATGWSAYLASIL